MLNFLTLNELRDQSICWRILQSDLAPIFLNFAQTCFEKNHFAQVKASDAIHELSTILDYRKDSNLFTGQRVAQKDANSYIKDWVNQGWLIESWPTNGESFAYYDLHPEALSALEFVKGLERPQNSGTESKLKTIIDLLEEIELGQEQDLDTTIALLEQQIQDKQRQIERYKQGVDSPNLDDHALRDRFKTMQYLALSLPNDFKKVEYDLSRLHLDLREKITKWQGPRGSLLDEFVMGSSSIEHSDQGRTVEAFSKLILNHEIRQKLSFLLDAALDNKKFSDLEQDGLKDFLIVTTNANQRVRSKIADISRSLASFIKDKTFIENKIIYEELRDLEITILDKAQEGIDFEAFSFELNMPKLMKLKSLLRPMYNFKKAVVFDSSKIVEEVGSALSAEEILSSAAIIDYDVLRSNINTLLLKHNGSCNLKEVIETYPLLYGIKELIAYLNLIYEEYDYQGEESITYIKLNDMHELDIERIAKLQSFQIFQKASR